MKLRRSILLILILLTALMGTNLTLHGQTEASLIAAMESRLPSLMELKLSGKVGETNLALVAARLPLELDERRLIENENRDRLAHYTLIAQRIGVPVSVVQSKRAEQIRIKSPRGVWVQSKSGDWFRE